MALFAISRSLSIEPNPKIPSTSPKIAKCSLKISLHMHKRPSPAMASIREDGGVTDGGNKALELNWTFNGSVPDRDPQTLPRPLTNSDLSNLSSGSRLKVAYQCEKELIKPAQLLGCGHGREDADEMLGFDLCRLAMLKGLPGAYSESAAAKAYPNCEAVPCEHFETAFEAVEHSLVDRAVLPIENSLGGSIHRNYDLLLRHKLHIVGEVKYAVRHCLLANHGVKLEDLKRVLSHPQALAQCEHTLTKWGVVREAVDDTAGAAQFVASNKLQDAGAVASSLAAGIYDLNILAENIQDDSDNVTRFLMLAREPIIAGIDRLFKTSIVFSLEEGPGMLFKALAVFAMRDVNLTKIESRPRRKKPFRTADEGINGPLKYFDYLFYVDFEASMAAPNAQNALRHLKEFATFLRVLGSYPMDVSQT